MSVEAAAGYPQIADQGMIMTAYAKEFNTFYRAETLLPRITTGKLYESVLNQGDAVVVANLPKGKSRPYTKGQKLAVDTMETVPITMTVNRARYFNVLVDAVDVKQMHIKTTRQKYQNQNLDEIQEAIEIEFFESVYAQAHAKNQGSAAGVKSGKYGLGTAAAPVTLSKDNATELVTRVRAVLAEQSAAKGKLWLIVPAWARYLLVNSDLKNASLTGDDSSVMRTGRLGMIDNVTIYESNLLYDSALGTYIIGGNMDAISFISQFKDAKMMDSEIYNGTLIRGFEVYDWNVRKPEGLVVMHATM